MEFWAWIVPTPGTSNSEQRLASVTSTVGVLEDVDPNALLITIDNNFATHNGMIIDPLPHFFRLNFTCFSQLNATVTVTLTMPAFEDVKISLIKRCIAASKAIQVVQDNNLVFSRGAPMPDR